MEHLIEPFVSALVREIERVGKSNPGYGVHTIYFGGGTPTLLKPEYYHRVLDTILSYFEVTSDVEISTEANPNDLMNPDYVQALRGVGLSRLSIGVQSMMQSELEMFGRLHDANTVAQAVANARQGGFNSLNLDLIYGVPRQTLAMWQKNLEAVLRLEPDHLSLYALGLEPDTAMDVWVERGKLPLPDDDLAADMYEWATDALNAAGFIQYEISNWAKPGHESVHNLQYWRNLPYLGLGPGAHGYAGGIRYETVRSPRRYVQLMEEDMPEPLAFPLTPAVNVQTPVSREDEISETIMMGMRLLEEGIPLQSFQERFGISLLSLRGDMIETFAAGGYLALDEESVRLTPQGRLVNNRILRDLI